MDVNDELAVIRCAGIPELRFTARTRVVAAARARRCSWRRPRWRRARPTRSSCTAPSTSGRAGASASRSPENNQSRVTPPGWNWYLPFGLDTPAKVYSLWYQRYMHTLRRHQRRLRALPGRRAQARGDQPGGLLLPAAAHARGAPGVALDRRADPAQARLLPGERRRRRAGRHELGPRPRPAARRRCASPPRPRRTCATAKRCSTTTSATARRSPRPRSSAAQLYEATGLTPDDIDVAMIYENFTPIGVPAARGVRVLRPR